MWHRRLDRDLLGLDFDRRFASAQSLYKQTLIVVRMDTTTAAAKAWASAARIGHEGYMNWWIEQRLPFADMNQLEEVHGAGCFITRLEAWLDTCPAAKAAHCWERLRDSSAHQLGVDAYWAMRPSDRDVVRNLRLLHSIQSASASPPAGDPARYYNS